MAGLRDLRVGARIFSANLLRVRFARAGGPGGQNVNKVSSKVDLRLDLDAAIGVLGEALLLRVREKLATRLDANGNLQITSSEHRDQARNIEAALSRMETLLEGAMQRPKRRVKTKATRGSQERRLVEKKQRGVTKRGRGTYSGGPGEDR